MFAAAGAYEVPRSRPLLRLGCTAAALLLLLLSLFTYQSCAMIYWAMLAAFVVARPAQELGRRAPFIAFAAGVGFAAIGIYAFTVHNVSFLSPPADAEPPYTTARVSLDVAAKLRWFAGEPLPRTLSLWAVPASPWLIRAGELFLLAALLLRAGRLVYELAAGRCPPAAAVLVPVKGLLLLGLAVLCFLPNLLAAANMAPYRTLVALCPLTALVLYAAVREACVPLGERRAGAAVTAVLLLACLAGGYLANRNVSRYIAHPNTAEFAYLKGVVAHGDLARVTKIHVVCPEGGFPGIPANDEFGSPTTGNWPDHQGMIRCALRELGQEAVWNRGLVLSHSQAGKPFAADDRTLVIDMVPFMEAWARAHGPR
jgi:hypothetical protein